MLLTRCFKMVLNLLYELCDCEKYKVHFNRVCCLAAKGKGYPIRNIDLFSMGSASPKPISQISLWGNLEPFTRPLVYRGGI